MKTSIPLVALVILIVLGWEVAGPYLERYAMPAPSSIANSMWGMAPFIYKHLYSTLYNSLLGLIIGCLLGVFLGLVLTKLRVLKYALYGISVVFYILPAIAIAPMVVVLFSHEATPVVLSIITVFFPILILTENSLSQVAVSQEKLFSLYGASAMDRFIKLDIAYMVTSLFAGLQFAVPWALLGTMLGEFVGGRWGLGTLMLGSLGNGDASKLWAIAMIATFISAFFYWLLGLIKQRTESWSGLKMNMDDTSFRVKDNVSLIGFVITLLSVFILWELFYRTSPLADTLVLGPVSIINGLFEDIPQTKLLLKATLETLIPALYALLTSIILAYVWAYMSYANNAFGNVLEAVLLITQTAPLLALAPLFILVFGRGLEVTIIIAILAVIFPAYIAILNRLQTIPEDLKKVCKLYNRTRIQKFLLIELPWSLSGIAVATRIATPRILLGVMLAEYLATGKGLGFMIEKARGRFDMQEMWSVLLVLVILGVTLYYLSLMLEKKLVKE